MSKLKTEVIKYSKKLNITNLSALRSGNISVRAKEKSVEGFYITLLLKERDVAQLGSASALGAGCRRFKSCHPDLVIFP